jgi:hypothetical protein
MVFSLLILLRIRWCWAYPGSLVITQLFIGHRPLTGWLRECSGRGLGVSVGATTVESPDQVSIVRIPPEYANLALAFCKRKATQLPPHRRGDCALNLLVDAALPRSHVCPLSQEETVAIETYVSESLHMGYIRLSSS